MKLHVNQLTLNQLEHLAEEHLFGDHESSLAVSCPASNWEDGGHAVEKLLLAGMQVKKVVPLAGEPAKVICTMTNWRGTVYFGDTLLDSAMRCLLGHERGDILEVPDHLR